MRKIRELSKKYLGVHKGKVWHLYSDDPTAQDIDICYVGTEAHKNTILHAFFPRSGKQQFLGEQYFWKAKHYFPRRKNYDLAIIECEAADQIPDKHSTGWFVPRWIKTYVDIPVENPTNSYKYNLRVIKNNQFDYWVTTDATLVKEFYE